MEARTWRSRAGGAVRLASAVAALATPPLLLTVVIGNPFPSWPIEWARVVRAVQVGLVPWSTWVNILALTAWTVWGVLVGMLAVEVVAVARNRPSPAGVPDWIRRLAQVLVAAAITLGGPAQQSVALSSVAAPSMVAAAGPVHAHGGTSLQSQAAAEGRVVTVAEGDSWGGFAADVLGDAGLGPEVRAANLGRQVGDGDKITEATAFVEPGWQLLIPSRLDRGPRALTDERIEPDIAVNDTAEPEKTWEVERGDHMWGIAEMTLTESWERPPTDAEIAPYWRQIIEANRHGLLPPGDPDLIYPGQKFVMPSPPRAPGEATSNPATAPSTASEREQAAAEPQAPTDRPAHGGTMHSQESPAPVHAKASADRDSWQAAVEHDAPASAVEETPHGDGDEAPRTALGTPMGLAAGTAAAGLLAAGVTATLRWRRRALLQQRAPGLRLPTPWPDTDAEIAKLHVTSVPEETLDDFAALLASIPLAVHPVLVRASDSGQITLLFDERAGLPEPPHPWTLVDDGTHGPVGWQAQIGDRGPERSSGIPLLVTLGRSGTSTVLSNVGAMGTLGVAGPSSETRRRLRAMSLELATSRVSFPVEVAIAGDERLTSLDRVRLIDNPADEVEQALAEVGEVVIDDRVPRLLVCHHGAVPPDVPEELIGMVGVLAVGAATAGTWLLDIQDEHTGRLRLPDGGNVRLALPDIDPELIDDELARLDEPASLQPIEPTEDATAPAVHPGTNGDALHSSLTQPAWCELRLLGPVEVVCNGARVEGLTPGTLEVLVYLATHPDGVTKERLDDVIWGGAAARPGSQRVTSALTKLRKVLGDGPDGRPLVPRRAGDEPIALSPHVSTDLDRASAHLALARDLPAELRIRELSAALELVRGEPLEGRAYSWATDTAERALVQLQDTALELARACREAGDIQTAERAVEQGLKLLDPNGWLYLERARLARLRGRPEQPSRIFEQYRRKLADDADEIAGTVAIPPPEIELAFRELMAHT